MKVTTKLPALVLAASLLLAGCAALQRVEAQRTEELLAEAGFRARPADTAEMLADLKAMPPRKLVSQARDGHLAYSYSDPDDCVCLYVGGPQEYSAYQRLVQRENPDKNYHAEAD